MTEARTCTDRRIGHELRRKAADREFGNAVATFPAHRVEDLVELPRLVGKLVVGAMRLSN